ncbi:hypothetical protein Pam2_127 [Pseudanabaena phage Pam2]|nr:hypothetical protein Pam2_127 [Pseudanabaena phage Pam2]
MWQQLVELWNRLTRESEEWEYFEYLRKHPDRAQFLEGKTKAELAQELNDWKVRSSEQAQTIMRLESEIKAQEQQFWGRIKRSYKQVIR